MGMGDLKLVAAVGAWIGPSHLDSRWLLPASSVELWPWLGAVGGFAGELFQGTGDLLFGLRKRGLRPHPELVLANPLTRKMPYAPAIAIGTLISFFGH